MTVLATTLTFAHPAWLIALAVLPLLVLLYLAGQRRRRRDAVRFASLATLASVMPRSPGAKRHVGPLVLLLAAAALVVALARPRHEVLVPRERASIVLVTDTSGSMQATDVQPDRLSAARNAADEFLDDVPKQIRVGAVAFSSTAATLQTPSTDRQSVKDVLGTLLPAGGTATGTGLEAALRALRPPGDRIAAKTPSAIVLLSDGAATSGSPPDQVAERSGRAGIPIYTIALGTPDGSITTPDGQELAVPPDPEALQQIARESHGRFFDAPSADALKAAYKDLGSRLGKVPERHEITNELAGIGLVLLVAGAGLGLLLTGRLP